MLNDDACPRSRGGRVDHLLATTAARQRLGAHMTLVRNVTAEECRISTHPACHLISMGASAYIECSGLHRHLML